MSTFDPRSRPGGGEALALWYAEALAEQLRRGISVSEFAAEIGVSAVTLYQWRRRLAAGAETDVPVRAAPKGLIELKLDERSPAPSGRPPFRLDMSEQGVLEIPADFDEQALTRLLGVLRAC